VQVRLRKPAVAGAELPCGFGPLVGAGHRDDLGQVEPGHAGKGAREFDRARLVVSDQDRAGLRTPVAQDPRQAARVDVGDRDHLLPPQILGERLAGAEVRVHMRQVAHDQPGRVHAVRLDILGIGAGIADVRVGKRDDLPAVARIGQDLLVAGHRRVEHDFADGMAGGADGEAAKDRPIG
jgi:hypothetical protein